MNQNQVRILIGGIIILIVIGTIFFFRNEIQNLLNQKNINNNPTSSQSNEEKVVRNMSGKIIEVTIKGATEVDEYKVVVENELELKNTLIEWGVFGKTYGKTEKEIENENLLNLVTVTLTREKQPFFLEGKDDNKLAASAGFELNGKELKILVYVAPDSLGEANDYFNRLALRMLYGIANPPVKGREQAQTDAFNTYYQEKSISGITHFKVEQN